MKELRCPLPNIKKKDNKCNKLLAEAELEDGTIILFCSVCKKKITFAIIKGELYIKN